MLSVVILTFSGLLRDRQGATPPCLIRRTCHIPCPGCGLTRSFEATWKGDLTASFYYHPLGLPLFLLLALCAGAWALGGWIPAARRLAEQLERGMAQPRVWLWLLAIWLGTWGLRLAWANVSPDGFWW